MVEVIDDRTVLIQTSKFPIYIISEDREKSDRLLLNELKKVIIKEIKKEQLENTI
jgi:predicted metallopeptidase